jgi:hypothetical protein
MLIDKFGHIIDWLIATCVLHSFCTLMLLFIEPYWGYIVFGFGFAVRVSVTFPILDLTIKKE